MSKFELLMAHRASLALADLRGHNLGSLFIRQEYHQGGNHVSAQNPLASYLP